jgi:cell division protease FtsH
MNEAAIFAAREDRKKVSQFDLAEAVDKVSMGPERKSHIMSPEEKQITAYHELGHAIIASVTPDADPVSKITIIPRGRAAGFTMSLPEEDRKMKTKNDFLANLDVFMGGYLAEKLIFGDVSTGPSNDLARATDMARDMVTKFGMSEKVGALTLSNAHKNLAGGEDDSSVRYSAKLAELVDSEVSKIMSDSYKRGEKIIKRHEEALHAISKRLLKVETLEREEYEDLLKEHKVPIINRKMKAVNKIKK